MTRDRLALITGGSSGIGKQLAADFLRRGTRVVIVADNAERLSAAAAELERISPRVYPIVCDVGDGRGILRMAGEVLERHGCPDTLVNNAGFATFRTFEASALEEIERLVDVNLVGAMRCTKAFLPEMIRRRRGHIVNMASIAGRIPMTPNGVYSAAKHAMVAWSENLRHELARFNILVSVICPGRVETPFFDHETFRSRVRGPETKRVVSVERVSRATLRAVERGQAIVYVPWTLGLAVWLTNVAPFVVKPLLGRIIATRVESLYQATAQSRLGAAG